VLSFEALAHIGHQHAQDTNVEPKPQLMFDSSRAIHYGLTKIITELFEKFLERLLPMTTDWTDPNRKFGFAALRCLLQLGQGYCSRYVPQLLQKLSQSLRESAKDAQSALQCSAILACFTSGKEILEFIVPRLSVESTKDIVVILAVTAMNSPLDDGDLLQIIEKLLEVKMYENLEVIDPLVQLLLAIIQKSPEFANSRSADLLVLILKVCEKTDALKFFADVFGRPISSVFAEQMEYLLQSERKTPEYLTHLLLTSPVEAVAANQESALQAILVCLGGGSEWKAMTHKLLRELIDRGVFLNVSEVVLAQVIDDMVWSPGKDKVAYRQNATYVMASLIERKALSDELFESNLEKILPVILSSMDDSWADVVRIAGVRALSAYVDRRNSLSDNWEKIYPAIKERLDDHLIEVRVGVAWVLARVLMKCQDVEGIEAKWNEILIFVDDENAEIRQSIGRLVRLVGQVDKWRGGLRDVIAAQHNFHEEANAICQELVHELE
jgi:hypothetical protein